MNKWCALAPAILAVTFAVACETQKVPAEQAMAAAESAWAAVSTEATKLVPDQAKTIETAMASAKAAMAKADYATALKEATALPPMIADVQKAVVAKKAEFAQSWGAVDGAVSGMVTAIQTTLDASAKRLPRGIDKKTVEGAKTSFATLQAAVADAKTAYEAGNYTTAIEKANAVKADAMKLMQTLKIEPAVQ